MKAGAISITILIAALASAAPRLGEPGARRLDQTLLQAMKAGDIDALMALFDPDAVMLPPGELALKGQEPIRFRWDRLLKANRVREASLFETGYRTSGNLSAGWGRFRMTLDPKKGGPPVNVEGRFSHVAENKGGRWVYVFMMMGDLDEPLTFRRYSGTVASPPR